MSRADHWERFKKYFMLDRASHFSMDVSCMGFGEGYFEGVQGRMKAALDAMAGLEAGAIANPDEQRMVGHYWLRNPTLAPNADLRKEIEDTLDNVREFGRSVHGGELCSQTGEALENMLVIGIGGSALGPQFVTQALTPGSIKTFFFDNVDPDGMEKTLAEIPSLARTLTLVISKSGGTKETRSGYLVAQEAYRRKSLDFSRHAVAITGEGSELDRLAKHEGWLARFPMWDWVGGRTSEMSAVGLLPAAIQGVDIDALLRGAREMDNLTRAREIRMNPAAMLSIMWLYAVEVKRKRAMVILPYKDRLELFSRYLQQLIMESLGKEHDLAGNTVHEGIMVFGNKGSTDQHAYVQQLRDGVDNFFTVFIEVLGDRSEITRCDKVDAVSYQVEPSVTCGDYLSGFYQGTRSALREKGRESITVTIPKLGAHSVGMLIALFERAVGYYAFLVNINAYHQPGVEAGKKAAAEVLKLQRHIVDLLSRKPEHLGVEEITGKIGDADRERVFKILQRLAANGMVKCEPGASVFDDLYYMPK